MLNGTGVTVSLSANSGQTITFSETGSNVGNATSGIVTVVATDANGVSKSAVWSFGVQTLA